MVDIRKWFDDLPASEQLTVLTAGKHVIDIAYNLKISAESAEFDRLIAAEKCKREQLDRQLADIQSCVKANHAKYIDDIRTMRELHVAETAAQDHKHAERIKQISAEYESRLLSCKDTFKAELMTEKNLIVQQYQSIADAERDGLINLHAMQMSNVEEIHRSKLACEIETRENRIKCLERAIAESDKTLQSHITELQNCQQTKLTEIDRVKALAASDIERAKNTAALELDRYKSFVETRVIDTNRNMAKRLDEISGQLLTKKSSREIGEEGENLVYRALSDVYGMTESFSILCTNKQKGQTDIHATIYGVRMIFEVKNKSSKTLYKEYVKFKNEFIASTASIGVFVTLGHGIDRFDSNDMKCIGNNRFIFIFPAVPSEDYDLTKLHLRSWKLPILVAKQTIERTQNGSGDIDKDAMFAATSRTVSKIQAIADDARKRKRESDLNWSNQVADVDNLVEEVFNIAKIAKVDGAVDVKITGAKSIPESKIKSVMSFIVSQGQSLPVNFTANDVERNLATWAPQNGHELVDVGTIGKCLSNMQYITKNNTRPASYNIRQPAALERIVRSNGLLS